MDFSLKLKLNGKQLYESNSLKYTGIRIGNKLLENPYQWCCTYIMLYNVWVTYSLCMHYMGTEFMHNQLSFHTSKESIKIDSF